MSEQGGGWAEERERLERLERRRPQNYPVVNIFQDQANKNAIALAKAQQELNESKIAGIKELAALELGGKPSLNIPLAETYKPLVSGGGLLAIIGLAIYFFIYKKGRLK